MLEIRLMSHDTEINSGTERTNQSQRKNEKNRPTFLALMLWLVRVFRSAVHFRAMGHIPRFRTQKQLTNYIWIILPIDQFFLRPKSRIFSIVNTRFYNKSILFKWTSCIVFSFNVDKKEKIKMMQEIELKKTKAWFSNSLVRETCANLFWCQI